MMTRIKQVAALVALTTVAACDFRGRDYSEERADGDYRTAMADYRAGRLKQAAQGLKEVCEKRPMNMSARFQLACLLQDSEKDYLSAYCAYREYLVQCPQSEKAKLAADRMADCEREMAHVLAAKYASESEREVLKAAQATREALTKSETEGDRLRNEVAELTRNLASAREEVERLKGLMRAEAVEDAAEPLVTSEEIAEAKELLSKEDAPLKESQDEIADALNLLEEDAAATPVLKQAPNAKEVRAAARAEEKAKPKVDLYPHEARPESYVVQEGDTLYKLAVRFYGRASEWTRIRDANRATISNDGRLRTGRRIVLP